MSAPTLVTVCDAKRVAEAVALAGTYRALEGDDSRVLVVVADAASITGGSTSDRHVEILTGRDVAAEHIDVLRAGLRPAVLARALMPFALARAGGPAVALDPTLELVAPLTLPADAEVFVFAADGGSVVDERAMAVTVTGPASAEVLEWWQRRVVAFDVDGVLGDVFARFDTVALIRRPPTWSSRSSEDQRAQPAANAVPLEPPAVAAFAEELADGTPMDDRLRRLFVRGFSAGELDGSPVGPDGCAAFARWLREPESDTSAGGVSRYLFDLWQARSDLRASYPDLTRSAARHGFLGWAAAFGAREVPIPAWLVPEHHGEASEQPTAAPLGINVAGYFQSELGVGEAARRVVEALDAVHVPVLPVQSRTVPPSRRQHEYGALPVEAATYPVNLVCVNADGVPAFAEEVGPTFFAGRLTIGSWWWELPTFPEHYRGAFDFVDEIWVGTTWVQETIARIAPVPVLKMPVAVRRPSVAGRTRAELGLPEGFMVLFLLDYNSVLERKNPLGLIDAFIRAFPDSDSASLVIKTTNGDKHARDRQRLTLAASRHPHVHLLERYVSAGERDALIASCDLYASLHRSEGFGLTMAEAMALERPVLATGWSGNCEFMHPETTELVPYELVEVGTGNEPYDAASVWAAPDLDAAAEAMLRVRDDPDRAVRRARGAAARLLEDHAPEVAGKAMRERLEVLAPVAADRFSLRTRRMPSGAEAVAALDTADRRLAIEPSDYPSRDPARRVARKLLVRIARPVVENQRAIDQAVMHAVRSAVAEPGRLIEAAETRMTAFAELTAALLARDRASRQRTERNDRRAQELEMVNGQLAARVAVLEQHMAETANSLAPLVRGAAAIPWMQDDALTLFDDPLAGRVLGYRNEVPTDVESTYRAFEDVFRGSRGRVRGLLEAYVDLLREHSPVLDVGAGRGELLELLRDAAVAARGVDADAGMASGARENGLEIVVADGIEYLEAVEPGSLGAVTAIHVIEHLPMPALERFLAASLRSLRCGGLLVCETVNPHAAYALKTFWVDPSHQHPLFPETTLVLARAAGFPTAYITHLRGVRDVERDRYAEDSYALVATRS